MNTKHTPGPWHRNIKPASHYPTIFAGRNTHVAVVQTRGLPEPEQEANTYLIAAAPDLLAALKMAKQVLHPGVVGLIGNHHGAADCVAASNAVFTIDAAIAKAEGKA